MSDEQNDVIEPAPETPEKPLDAVIVVKTVGENGAVSTDIVLNGSMQATEVQTILELGLKAWRKKIGLSKE